MRIEILFPEICALYGDNGNILLLEKTFGKENIIKTSILETPIFTQEKVDMIYIGAMSEKAQVQVLNVLLPYRDLLLQKVDAGMKALFTGNAMDLLGNKIIEEDGSEIQGLGYFDFETVIKRSPRLNAVVYGYHEDFPINGFKTQFTQSYAKKHENYFVEVEKGMGINKESNKEGFIYKGLIGTNLTGPFLIVNPGFARAYLGKELPHQALLEQTQAKRIEDIKRISKVVDL